MTTVILAEKPNQAKDYADAFKSSKREKKYIKVSNEIFNDDTYITWAVGHLVELAMPEHYNEKYKSWKIEDLPIFPKEMEFQVSKNTKEQFNVVKSLLKKADTIVIATDPDREGENIAWSILNQLDITENQKEIKRLWINSLEKDVIFKGLNNLLNAEETKSKYIEAKTRQISDWLVGMNGSRLFTIEMQKKGIKSTFSIGRVQTPTLYMVYERNKYIENFVKAKYYELSIELNKDNIQFKGILKPNERFNNRQEVQDYLKKESLELGLNQAMITKVEIKKRKESSPSLFSLSELQKLANKLYKKNPKETLSAVQKLYDLKLLTYPRTKSVYITDSEFNYLKQNLDSYKEFLNIESETPILQARKKYVDNEKVLEHHAIILTKKVPSNSSFELLSTFEQQIYNLVAIRTVSMFMPDYEYQQTIVNSKVKELNFESKGITPLKQGWKEQNKQKTVEKVLPKLSEGDIIQSKIKEDEKETTPPSYFTEGTLLDHMKTLGKDLDSEEEKQIMKELEGLGTEATRGDIIETLKNNKMIVIEKNKVMMTEKGKLICQAIEKEKLLRSPELTSKWELYLKKIGEGKGDATKFINNIKKFIVHLLEVTPENINSLNFEGYEKAEEIQQKKLVVGNCPKCDHDLLIKKGFYGCSNYPGCKFSISNNFRGNKISKTQIAKLLKGDEITIKSIKKKDSSKTYNAKISLQDDGKLKMISFAK